MGTWGTGIFDDDVALDVRGSFEDALAEGLDIGEATQRVRVEYKDQLDDMDDGPVICLALAALQLEHGALQEEVRREALATIGQERGFGRWEETDEDTRAQRRRVLDELATRLRGSAPG